MGKQNFRRSMKTVFEPITDTVKQTAQQLIGAVKNTIKAIELKIEETKKAINEANNNL